MRTELDAARNFKEAAEASMLAKAGIARALADLVNGKTKEGITSSPFRPYSVGPVQLGGGTYRVTVTDEESRISLHGAPPSVLNRLLRNTGVSDVHRVNTIVDSILDWRDHDDVHRQNGAETAYYRSLPVPYFPRNGPFEVVEELLLVEGMTPEIFYGTVRAKDRSATLKDQSPVDSGFLSGEYLGIRSMVTVHGSGDVVPNTASLDVLVAAGLPISQAREILQSEGNAPISDRLTRAPRLYRVESVGQVSASPLVSRVVATLEKEDTQQGPRFKVVAWQEVDE